MQSASDTLADQADNLRQSVTSAAQDAKNAVSSRVEALSQSATETLHDTRDRVSGALRDTTDMARDSARQVADSARQVAEGARQMASDAVDTIGESYRSGVETIARTGDEMAETLHRTKDNLMEAIESHPLIVGGIGLVLGAIVASAMPVTRTENELFGRSSDELKSRARDMASMATDSLNVAKDAAVDVYQDSVKTVQERGLSPEVASEAVKNAGQKVKELVNQASDALNAQPEGNDQSKRKGDNEKPAPRLS